MSKEANSIGKCPLCGSAVEDKSKGYFCSNRGCRFALWKNNRYFASIGKSITSATAQKLLDSGKIKLKNCKSERTGNTFDATVFMEVSEDGKTKFSMKNEKWDDVHGNTTPDDRMVAFLESPTDSYAILRLREDVEDNICIKEVREIRYGTN